MLTTLWDWLGVAMGPVGLGGALLVAALGPVLVIFQLPGTWLILAVAMLTAWWRWDLGTIGAGTLILLALLVALGEVVEFFAGAAGSRRAGGSKRGAVLAVVGGLVGAVLGSLLLPLIGTLAGACVGAGVGAALGDRWAGREWGMAMRVGRGAAVGKFWGTMAKAAIAVGMWAWLVVAVVV